MKGYFNTEDKVDHLSLIQDLISEETADNYTLKALICIFSRYAIAYLTTRHNNDRLKFLNMGLTFEDISIDAVTPLIIKNNKTKEIGIVKSFKDWKALIETEAQAQYFFYRIITNRVEQEITRILREADPFFSKILNAVNYVIEKNNWQKITWCGTVFIIHKNIGKEKKFIQSEEFDSIPTNLFFDKPAKVISNLFEYLKNETKFYRAIPLNSLIKKLRNVQMDSYSQLNNIHSYNNEEKLDIDEITSKCLLNVIQKLNDFYFNKGKITSEEKDIFISVLTELINDLRNGGLSRGLYQYMNDYMPNLTKNEFYKDYHQILDYLFRTLKSDIFKNLDVHN